MEVVGESADLSERAGCAAELEWMLLPELTDLTDSWRCKSRIMDSLLRPDTDTLELEEVRGPVVGWALGT